MVGSYTGRQIHTIRKGKDMKRHGIIAYMAIVAVFGLTVLVSLAQAGDVVLEAKIQSSAIAKTKTGSPYVRLIIEEERSLNGVTYMAGVPVMVFDETLIQKAKNLKTGNVLKGIASESQYHGKTSYVLLAILN